MENTTKYIKKIVLVSTLIGLFIPLIQMKFQFFQLDKLEGAVERKELPEFSFKAVKTGNFQTEYSAFFKNQFGFNELFVRINNQKKFSLFNKPSANGVVLGKNGYLYEENYILAHLGRDFIGYQAVKEKIKRLNSIKNILNDNGKEIVIVFAPGKGSFFPEHIPERYKTAPKEITNYEVFTSAIGKTDIKFIDFHAYFDSIKSKTSYTLYPKNGIHWSKFSEFIAADSIISFIENEFDLKMNRFRINDTTITTKPWDTDNDIEKGLNLLFALPSETYHYPNYEVEAQNDDSTRVLSVSDSFYWGMFNMGMSERIFSNGEFWFYNEQIFPESYIENTFVKNIDFKERILDHDIVLMICTDANLSRFPFGFDEQFLDEFND